MGYSELPLETRFNKVRSCETNYGDFLADLARSYYDTDCCILNSGCIRNDLKIKAGKLNFSTISNLINDVLVVKQVPGGVLLEALEYSVSGLPASFAGCFLLVSGIKFTFDYRKTPKVQEVYIRNKLLDNAKTYTVTMKFYLSGGGDGFSMLKECPYLIDVTKGI